jgi:hypothetical protein
MLSKHLAVARRAMEPAWNEARSARVLERALEPRRLSRRDRPVLRMLALAGFSFAAAVGLYRVTSSFADPSGMGPAREPVPATMSGSVDALDGGKQTG